MKYLVNILASIFLISMVSSCKQRGCTTDFAKNYDATAQKDNKTCEYYYTAQISKIVITDFPDLDQNGENWDDDGSFPDLYIRFTNEEDVIKYQTPLQSNIHPGDTVMWSIPSFVEADTVEPNTQFKVYEVDDVSAELIEKLPINFLDYMFESSSGLEKYPDSVVFNGNSVSMKVFINWID